MLIALKKSYKYIINCSIVQKTGAKMVSAYSCYSNPQNDFILNLIWPKDKHKGSLNMHLYCIINIYEFSF